MLASLERFFEARRGSRCLVQCYHLQNPNDSKDTRVPTRFTYLHGSRTDNKCPGTLRFLGGILRQETWRRCEKQEKKNKTRCRVGFTEVVRGDLEFGRRRHVQIGRVDAQRVQIGQVVAARLLFVCFLSDSSTSSDSGGGGDQQGQIRKPQPHQSRKRNDRKNDNNERKEKEAENQEQQQQQQQQQGTHHKTDGGESEGRGG